LPLDCLKARLAAQRVEEKIGLELHQPRVTQVEGRIQPVQRQRFLPAIALSSSPQRRPPRSSIAVSDCRDY